ncbi:MAG TPA: nitroreductase family protein [Chitinophagaceae bacterium]|jgi:nitroreductase|nr:nitroreductase family protein [Chitinophagaceae bacterium]
MELLPLLNWRYATKKMNGRPVAPEKVGRILEAARLAPSSNGLQPFEILVIRSAALKEQIYAGACPQPQVVTCSHLLVFAAWDRYTEGRINTYLQPLASERGVPPEALEDFRQTLLRQWAPLEEAASAAHAARQAYLALGVALIAAAAEGVDSTPMEGFAPGALDALLGLKEQGLRSAVLLALGYRDAEQDWLVRLPKVRKGREAFVREIA